MLQVNEIFLGRHGRHSSQGVRIVEAQVLDHGRRVHFNDTVGQPRREEELHGVVKSDRRWQQQQESGKR